MKRISVAFVCHFSDRSTRQQLPLKTWKFRNIILKVFHHPLWRYDDYAIWVSDFVSMFKRHLDDVEVHVIAPHRGMKKRYAEFSIDGINYCFYKLDGSLLYDLFCAKTRWKERKDYSRESSMCFNYIKKINPDIVCLCGAENPEYASVVFRIKDKPVYLIPQTLLNDPKRIALGVASKYRIDFERKVYRHVTSVSSKGEQVRAFARECNPEVEFFPLSFPTHQPPVFDSIAKEYDFVFYANNVMKNKGIEDVLKALSIVKKSSPSVKLSIIGGCDSAYQKHLYRIIYKERIEDNVLFSGKYESIDDVFYNVQKARVVVVPGISATLNSTVRESMLMGMPVIVYSSSLTESINEDKHCLLIAKMEDVEDLAKQMLFAITNGPMIKEIAQNGKDYADREFSNHSIETILIDNITQIVGNQIH